MKRRTVKTGIMLLLLAYVASYFVCRKIYETREDEFITLYDEDSIIALVAHLLHAPLIVADSAVTGRRIEVGNWRDSLHRDPHSSVYTKAQPKVDDLIGAYVPDQATASLITREGHYRELPASITLGADSALSITNIPDWWGTDHGVAKGGFDSGHGTWKVVQHREWWAISAHFESVAQFASTQQRAKDLYTSFRLVGERPPYKILLLVGSPHDGRAMQFERVQHE